MNIIDKILNQFFKPKKSLITNDLNKLELKGQVEKITTSCKKVYHEKYSSSRETNNFDETERKYSNVLIFNPFGFKIQEIQYNDRKYHSYDIKTFEYDSDFLINSIKSVSELNNHNYTFKFKYIYKQKYFKQLIYLGNKLTLENRFYFNNKLNTYLIKEFTYLPNTISIKEIHIDENGNIVRKTKSYLDTIIINMYEKRRKIKSVTSIGHNLVTSIAKYKYENNNCVEISFYRENGELFRSDILKYDINNNWINRIINYHGNCIYEISRRIYYYH